MESVTPPMMILPANEASWPDVQDIFGDRGPAHQCQCQRYKLAPGEAFSKQPVEQQASRLRQQTGVGAPRTATRLTEVSRPSKRDIGAYTACFTDASA